MSSLPNTAAPPLAADPSGAAPVRVCFVINNLSRAGTESQLLLLIRHLDRTRVRPFLCLLDGTSDSSRRLEPDDCPIVRLGVRRLLSLRGVKAARRFRRFLKENRIDTVVTYFPDSTRFAAPLAKSAGCTVFGTRRNVGHGLTRRDRLVARVWNRLFIDKIIANCQACKNAVVAQEAVNPEDVIVIPNAIDLSRFEHIPPWTPKPPGTPRKVGMVANLRPVKRPDLFIRAASLVLRDHPDTQFEIAGGGDVAAYQALIDELGLTQNVRLLGSIEHIPAFLSTLDVAVLTSEAEGLSNSLLEYMAAGRPIVATDVGGNSELIANGVEGILVPELDHSMIAQATLHLFTDQHVAECAAEAARETLQSRFCPARSAESFIAALKHTAPRPRLP